MTTPRAYTVATLAEAWGCSSGVIRKLIADNRLAHFRIGILIRIPAEEVRRFECQNIRSNDSEADMRSSIETQPADDIESGFMPRTGLGLNRRLGGAGESGATVHHGPWGR